jgi:uncharacterized protein (DUF4415 family)
MKFEWDEHKRRINLEKHGLDFMPKSDFKRIDNMSDGDIDFSDIPPLTDEQLLAMKPLGEVFPDAIPQKVRITIRLDANIVSWFKEQVRQAGGGNYQTLINDALRKHIENQKESLPVMSIDEWEDTLRRVIREELQAVG